MLISVVIPTLNGEPWLNETLAAIRGQALDDELELLCIDSGSRDRTREICLDHGARLLAIAPETFNHGATRNEAIGASRGEIICLLTQDALPANESWLGALVAAVAAGPKVAGAYSRQLPRPDATPITRYLLEHWLTGRTRRLEQRIDDYGRYLNASPFEQMQLVCFDNVSSALRREVWEKYPFARLPFAEDIEWAKRVIEAGYTIIYEPASVVIHSHDRAPIYEFKRTYVCHRILFSLFGMRLIPHWWQVFPCTRAAWRTYRQVLAASPRGAAWRPQLDALLRSFLSNAAQYLGGSAHAWKQRLPLPRRLGARLRRNV